MNKTEWYDAIKPTKEDFEKDAINQLRIAKERLAEIGSDEKRQRSKGKVR